MDLDLSLSLFDNYNFTGPLRPVYTITTSQVQVKCPDNIISPDYAITKIPTSEFKEKTTTNINVYNTKEIAKIRHASVIGREVLDIAGKSIKIGVTGEEINTIVHNACIERNAYPSPLNYLGFPKSVCVSVNEVICHGIPDSRPFEDGDIINIDVSVYVDGYHSDLNETFMLGTVDKDSYRLVKASFLALKAAADMIRPGTFYRDLGTQITKIAGQNQCSVVKSYAGHGVGKVFHGNPQIPHYAKNKAIGIMRPGHIFTIEPMLNLGSWRDETWPDKWTVVTSDGKRSSQFEHTFLVTNTGCEILTARPGTSKTELLWDESHFIISTDVDVDVVVV